MAASFQQVSTRRFYGSFASTPAPYSHYPDTSIAHHVSTADLSTRINRLRPMILPPASSFPALFRTHACSKHIRPSSLPII